MEKVYMVIEEVLNKQYTKGVFSSIGKARECMTKVIEQSKIKGWYETNSVFIVPIQVDKF